MINYSGSGSSFSASFFTEPGYPDLQLYWIHLRARPTAVSSGGALVSVLKNGQRIESENGQGRDLLAVQTLFFSPPVLPNFDSFFAVLMAAGDVLSLDIQPFNGGTPWAAEIRMARLSSEL